MSINKSTIRTIEILELLSNSKNLTLSEISEIMEIPVASTSDILKALLEKQMVELANAKAKTYKLGVQAFLLGNSYISHLNIVEIATPFLEELADQTKYVAFLAKLSENSIVYLHKENPRKDPMFISYCQIGSHSDITITSLGKAMLAYNDRLLEKLLKKPLPKRTENSITDPEVLKKELAEIRMNKFSRDNFEKDDRITCVGFPIFDQTGRVDHAISISGYFDEARDMDREIELGKKCAEAISLRLGYIENINHD